MGFAGVVVSVVVVVVVVVVDCCCGSGFGSSGSDIFFFFEFPKLFSIKGSEDKEEARCALFSVILRLGDGSGDESTTITDSEADS